MGQTLVEQSFQEEGTPRNVPRELYPEISAGSVCPMLAQGPSVLPNNFHTQEFAGNAMKPCRVDNCIQIVCRVGGRNPGRGDLGNWGMAQIYQRDVVAVKNLIKILFPRAPFSSKRVFWYELLCYDGIVDSLANLVREKLGNFVAIQAPQAGIFSCVTKNRRIYGNRFEVSTPFSYNMTID